MILAKRNSSLVIREKYIPPGLWEQLNEDLSIRNPEYDAARRFGKGPFRRKVDKFLKFFRVEDGLVYLPRNYDIPDRYPSEVIDETYDGDTGYWKTDILLRDYQKKFLFTHDYNEVATDYILVAPCGSGKTDMAIWLAAQRPVKTMILVPTLVLAQQWKKRITEKTDASVYLYQSKDKGFPRDYDFYICSLDLFIRREFSPEFVRSIGRMILDECFLGDTMVDGKRIDGYRPGDMVSSFNHLTKKVEQKKVVRVSQKSAKGICTVLLEDGTNIWVTPEHPFYDFQTKEYVRIKDAKHRQIFLIRKNEAEESDGEGGNAEKGVGKYERSKIVRSWRKRAAYTIAAEIACGSSWQGMGDRVDCINQQGTGMSKPLQGRRRKTVSDDSDRNRWPESCFFESEEGGLEKNCAFEVIRVESVTFYERRHFDGSGFCGEGDTVYNLEVEDNHNYFAGGILVHNCHRLPVDSYLPILDMIPAKWRVTLTATFRRPDGLEKGLKHHLGEIWEMGQVFPRSKTYPLLTGIEMDNLVNLQKKVKRRKKTDKPDEIKPTDFFINWLQEKGEDVYETSQAASYTGDLDELEKAAIEDFKAGRITKTESAQLQRCIAEGKRANYGLVDSFLAAHPRRTGLCEQILEECLAAGRKVLFLSKRKEILRTLWKKFESSMLIISETAKLSEKDERFMQNEARIVFGIMQLAKEGLDVPALDTLILHLPVIDVEQPLGRIARLLDGKKPPIALYLLDDGVQPKKVFYKSREFIEINSDLQKSITIDQLKSVL